MRLIAENCVACGSCVSACPFGYLRLSHDGIPLVCDLCSHHSDGPACVRICQEKAVTAVEAGGREKRKGQVKEKGVVDR